MPFFEFIIATLIWSNSIDTNAYYIENNSVRDIGYNLTSPDMRIILPKKLHEISGITVTDSSSVACVQDEDGIIFFFDITKNEITKQIVFNKDGDYEGITCIDKTIYVLRSDGFLFKIFNYGYSGFSKVLYATGIETADNEGLCYDQKNNRLLIAPKGKAGKGPDFDDKRVIYAFDPASGKLMKDGAFDFDISDIKKFSLENRIDVPLKGKKKDNKSEPDIQFMISAIAINPISNKLYVLSGMEKLLFVFDIDGTIEHIEKLNSDLFNMPEGITFFNNGDMLISNEGQGKDPTLLRFNYLK